MIAGLYFSSQIRQLTRLFIVVQAFAKSRAEHLPEWAVYIYEFMVEDGRTLMAHLAQAFSPANFLSGPCSSTEAKCHPSTKP